MSRYAFLFGVILIVLVLTPNLSHGRNVLNINREASIITEGLLQHFHTKTFPPLFKQIVQKLPLEKFLTDDSLLRDEPFCTVCWAAFEAVILEVNFNLIPRDQLLDAIVSVCVALDLYPERVCRGAVDMNIDIFLHLVKVTPDITPDHFCGVFGQSHNCNTANNTQWTINVPEGISAERPELENPSEENALNILHLSDVHIDPLYKPDGNANCGEPICCQNDQADPTTEEDKCGYWTDYRSADVPWHFLEETVRQTKSHSFDYIYYTGDVISHRIWDTSIERNTKDIADLFNYFRDNYDVPIYPVLGNHEPSPLNEFTSEDISDPLFDSTWLFELAADLWVPWVGEEARATILRGGFYTASPKQGFRIIALNGNVCYTENWWLVHDSFDPFGQLQFLTETLKAAEENNESVHILSHIPSGQGSCLKQWSEQYHRVVNRFANTITGQFNGHTHKDEFRIYYNSSEPTQAISVAFNGASVTPASNFNPSYRLYTIDQATYTILNSAEWTFNLTLANSKPAELPEWYQLYSFRETYGIDNLQAKNVGMIPDKMVADHTLLDLYFNYKYRNSDPAISGGCDDNCKKENLCDIVTSRTHDRTQCDYYIGLYDSQK